jgi:hypothetical protein
MLEQKIFSHLRDECKKLIKSHEEYLAAGNAKSFEEYKHATGVIRGLALAIDEINSLANRLETSDE